MIEEQFFTILYDRLGRLESVRPTIILAAEAVIAAVTNGGRLVVYDENGQMNGESVYRNSGLKLPTDGRAPDGGLVDVDAKDVVIIYSLLPGTERSFAAFDKARDAGSYIVAVCPRTRGGVIPPGRSLAAEADVYIDDLSDADGAVLPEGWTTPIASTTGIMNDVVLWAFHGEIIDRMLARGMVPGVQRGSHLRGGRIWNRTVSDSLFNVRGW